MRLPDALRALQCVAAAAAAAIVLASPPAAAQAQDVAAIQAREARNADARTLAALERYRQALVARFGADPSLTMLQWSESEGAALVVRAGGAPEFVIRQGDAWKSTDGRQLRPWASPAVAAANAFPLSSVKPAAVRAWLDAWRKSPGHATDFVTDYQMGYDPAAGRVVIRATMGSMTTGRLSEQRFDPATGGTVAIAVAKAPPAAPPPPARRSDDLRKDIAIALAALRKQAPETRLGRVDVRKREIEFTMADRTSWTFDATHTLKSGRRYDGSFLCEKGWLETEVDWTALPALPRNGILAASLDDEDEAHARFTIDRSRDCGPLTIEVVYDNYRIPQPWVRFDARGRFLASR